MLESLHPPRYGPLRIAQIAPACALARRGTGDSIEELVSLLCHKLVARGDDMALFATDDSGTSAEPRGWLARGYEPDENSGTGSTSSVTPRKARSECRGS